MSKISSKLEPLTAPISSLVVTDPVNEDLVRAARESLRRWGQHSLVVVQRQGRVVRSGDYRVVAARQLGWTHLAVLVVDEADAFAVGEVLSRGPVGEIAGWDERDLAEHLDTLTDEQREDTGYTDHDLACLLLRIEEQAACR